MNWMNAVRVALMLSGIACLIAVTLTVLSLKTAVESTSKQLEANLTDINRVTLSLGGTVAQLRKAAESWQKASDAQAKETTESIRKVGKLLDQGTTTLANLDTTRKNLDALIVDTNASLNQQLIPQLNKAIASTTATIDGLRPVEVQATNDLVKAGELLSDPAFKETIANLNKSAVNVQAGTANLAAASQDVKDAVHRATRPASLIGRLGGLLFSGASKVGSIIAGYAK